MLKRILEPKNCFIDRDSFKYRVDKIDKNYSPPIEIYAKFDIQIDSQALAAALLRMDEYLKIVELPDWIGENYFDLLMLLRACYSNDFSKRYSLYDYRIKQLKDYDGLRDPIVTKKRLLKTERFLIFLYLTKNQVEVNENIDYVQLFYSKFPTEYDFIDFRRYENIEYYISTNVNSEILEEDIVLFNPMFFSDKYVIKKLCKRIKECDNLTFKAYQKLVQFFKGRLDEETYREYEFAVKKRTIKEAI